MKTKQFLRFAMIVFAILASNLPAWGDTASFIWAESDNNITATTGTKGSITLSNAKNSASTGVSYDADNHVIKLYASRSDGNGGSITFTASSATITAVTITSSSKQNQSVARYSTDGGSNYNSFSFSSGSATVTSISTSSFIIKNGQNSGSSNKTLGIYSVVITYSSSGGGTTYSITYNLNGGSGTTPTESNKAEDATFTLHNGTTGITAPSGKVFSKWKDQDDAEYSGGATYTMPAKNVTLTAQWVDLPKYTITYNAGTGTCATPSWTQGSYGASTTLPTATPPATCSGWSFAGWCTTSAGSADDNTSIRRRRQCNDCGKRFTTYEKVESIPLIVIKKDNNREPYDRAKIEAGVLRACHKRPISIEKINKLIDEVENDIFNLEEREIESSVIGEIVMDKMKDLEAVACVRFASVYREFKDVNTFVDELKKILDTP